MRVDVFEAKFQDRARIHRLRFWAGTALACVVGFAAARVGRLDLGAFLRDFKHIVDYFRDCLPSLGASNFGADLGAWYWGLGRWLSALFDTVLIAIISTFVSAVAAFICSFLASRFGPGLGLLLDSRAFELCRGVPIALRPAVRTGLRFGRPARRARDRGPQHRLAGKALRRSERRRLDARAGRRKGDRGHLGPADPLRPRASDPSQFRELYAPAF